MASRGILQFMSVLLVGVLLHVLLSILLFPVVCRTRVIHELMSSCGSVDRAPAWCLGSHRFDSLSHARAMLDHVDYFIVITLYITELKNSPSFISLSFVCLFFFFFTYRSVNRGKQMFRYSSCTGWVQSNLFSFAKYCTVSLPKPVAILLV